MTKITEIFTVQDLFGMANIIQISSNCITGICRQVDNRQILYAQDTYEQLKSIFDNLEKITEKYESYNTTTIESSTRLILHCNDAIAYCNLVTLELSHVVKDYEIFLECSNRVVKQQEELLKNKLRHLSHITSIGGGLGQYVPPHVLSYSLHNTTKH